MGMRIVPTIGLCIVLSGYAVTAFAQEKVAAGRDLAASCFTCHGTNGNSVGNVPPSLAGRDRGELVRMLQDFKTGKRAATIMHQQAKGYTDEQLEIIAGYFAAQKPAPARSPSKAPS
jgi:sulfide dehydrogenase cytochrome subunit